MKDDPQIIEEIKSNNQAFIHNELRPFLQIKSSTLHRQGIVSAIDYITSYISEFSERIERFEGEMNPLIFAHVTGETPEKLLIYMMYDTQPVSKQEKWLSNPFKGDIRMLPAPLDSLGPCIIARGAYNSKSPLIAFLNVIYLLKKHHCLPISLLLLFDGEEEMGSPTLLKFLKNNREYFKECTDAYYPAFKQDLNGTAVLKLGYKGILSCILKIYTSNLEVHSSYANIVSQPAHILIYVLNNLYVQSTPIDSYQPSSEADSQLNFPYNSFLASSPKIAVECLSKDYRLSLEEKNMINTLGTKKMISQLKAKAGITQNLIYDPKTLLIRYFFHPTFNLSTIKVGYLKKGQKNSIPNSAIAKIDIRFAHQISPKTLFNQIKERITSVLNDLPLKFEIKKGVGYSPSRVPLNSLLVKSLLKTFEICKTSAEIWPLSAAASPLNMIQKKLNISYITGGLGIGGNAHAANEYVQLDSILNARISYHYLLKNYRKFLIDH
ncbi:MAG: Succinyl-diaminopimelate desuccinylase [Promethearchaeota archaeon]|nr:MAG: Succinyl-diaminopimelate desuccinylase [Candidatus Lokiarchaeota archaeon]